jgi:hypothetical protein
VHVSPGHAYIMHAHAVHATTYARPCGIRQH